MLGNKKFWVNRTKTNTFLWTKVLLVWWIDDSETRTSTSVITTLTANEPLPPEQQLIKTLVEKENPEDKTPAGKTYSGATLSIFFQFHVKLTSHSSESWKDSWYCSNFQKLLFPPVKQVFQSDFDQLAWDVKENFNYFNRSQDTPSGPLNTDFVEILVT